MADLPIKELGDQAPVYERPFAEPKKPAPLDPASVPCPIPIADALERLVASPDLCSKRWVWEQYDHIILGNTVQRPGGDAAVVRIGDGPRALALTTDVTPRYCEADPFEGGKQAVAETWRNLTAVGARPLALTDNLNFGNPERPEIMGQFVHCVRGIAEACKALEFPVVSGNVSLYNETSGRAILPTPTIGGVGLLDTFTACATLAFKAADEAILLVGETKGCLGQSSFLATILGREDGAPPPVDLMAEKASGDFVRALIRGGVPTAVHDLSDGGLLVALAEMAMASGIGATLQAPPPGLPAHAYWFGEDQARYLLTLSPARLPEIEALAAKMGICVAQIGRTGGDALTLPGERTILVSALHALHESWLPTFMGSAG
jgi:phosphoribosylformylglycinamidine synthase